MDFNLTKEQELLRKMAAQFAAQYCEPEAAELDETHPKDLSGTPSLILRYLGRQESVWEAAKRYNTTIGDILAANGIETEAEIPCEKLLLIPKKRA